MKTRKLAQQLFYTPMEGGRMGKATITTSSGETNFFGAKPTKKLHREQCWECEGTGKVTIYPLFDIPCHACKGKGYTMELHIRFGTS